MAGSVNKVILVGNLGRDPESRSFQNGGKVVNLRIATSESWKDRNTGERKERTEWHSVVLHAEHAVGYAEKYLAKGSKVYVEGKLETRKWQDTHGQDRYSTEIVLRPFVGTFTFLSDPPASGDREPRGQSGAPAGGGTRARGRQRAPATAGQDMDDDVPF